MMNINRLKKRHNRSLAGSLVYELYIRLYRHSSLIRAFFQLFTSVKKPKGIFFIVGSYNAGTTVVKQAIASHPDVSCAPIEGDLLTSELSNMEEGGWHRCLYGNKEIIETTRNSRNIINARTLLKDWSPWMKNNVFFLEKSIANSVRMRQLRKAFPGCKFVNVIRSPKGVVEGIKKRSRPTDEASKKLNSNSYPDSLLYCQWSYIYGLIESDSIDKDTYNCSYENFIASPDISTESLFSFLGLNPIHTNFNSNTLKIGDTILYIRPSPKREKPIDYADPKFLSSEIERLKCD